MKSILKYCGWVPVLAGLILRAGAAANDTSPPASASSSPDQTISELLGGDPVVAKGSGFEIKRSELDRAVISAKTSASAQGQDIPAAEVPVVELKALQYLIRVQLLNGVATDDDKAKGKDKFDQLYADLKKSAGEDVLARKLKAQGLTEDEFRKMGTEQATAQVVLESKVTVTSADIENYYTNNPDEFEKPEAAKLQVIMMSTSDSTGSPLTDAQKSAKKTKLADIRGRALKGEDFGALAQEYSEDPAVKQSNGQLTIVRGMPRLPVIFETTSFGLQTNGISDVITTDYGFYLVKLLQKVPAGKATLAEATDYIKSRLVSTAVQKMLPDYEAKLRKDANLEILDAKLKQLDDTMPVGMTPVSGSSSPPAAGSK